MKKDWISTLLRFRGLLALFSIAASFLVGVAVASGQMSSFVPGNDKGLFVVENAWHQFAALKHHGEALAWRLFNAPLPSDYYHYQGLARYPGDGVPVIYVTQKASDKGGYLHVVKFGTRPTNGERLRSNLLKEGTDTEDTYPKIEDTWIRAIRFDGSLVVDSARLIDSSTGEAYTYTPYNLPAYVHPGGMSIVDDILFVPLDTPRQDDSPTGFIVLFDLSGYNQEGLKRRENPEPIHAIQLTHKIDNLAVTSYDFKPIGGGGEGAKYLVWVNGDSSRVTKFYRTTTSNLRDDNLGLIEVQDWDPNSVEDSGPDSCWVFDINLCWYWGKGAHQSSTFLRDKNGLLYMIGMRHPEGSPTVGSDYADLYWVREDTLGHFKLTYVAERHFYCAYDGGGGPEHMRICNFGAANNAYVSPSGELILYSIPHANEGWKDPDFVRLGEFRHRDVNYMGTCTRGTGWAELYDDKDFNDRSIMFDWADRGEDDFDYFNKLDGFNDKTSSVRWCAPAECNIKLYKHSYYAGDAVTLPGTGSVASSSAFGAGYAVDFDNDAVSSISFFSDCTSGNSPPIADAGPDRYVPVAVPTDSTAIVALDGSASSDPDSDPLTYTWTWDGDSIYGVRPNIRLPWGTTTVTLKVNDGMVDSAEDTVDIKVGGSQIIIIPWIPLLLGD